MTGPLKCARNRTFGFRAVQVQARPVRGSKRRASAQLRIGATLQIVQPDPDPVRPGLAQQRLGALQRRRERLGTGDIGRHHGANADPLGRAPRDFRVQAHVQDRGRAGQQRLRIRGQGADTSLFLGQHRLLPLNRGEPRVERGPFGRPAREAGVGVGVRVDQPRHQQPVARVDDAVERTIVRWRPGSEGGDTLAIDNEPTVEWRFAGNACHDQRTPYQQSLRRHRPPASGSPRTTRRSSQENTLKRPTPSTARMVMHTNNRSVRISFAEVITSCPRPRSAP